MFLRCRCLTKSPPAWCAFSSGVLLRMSGTQIMSQIWHPTQGQALVPQDHLWGPFWGSVFGAQFWGPVFGFSFGTQFWIRSGTKKSQLSVPLFGTKSGSIFGVQIFVLLILLIRAGFQVPLLGPKTDPVLEPKNQKNGSDLAPKFGTQSDLTNTNPDLAPK